MKSMMALLALGLAVSANAFECKQNEAQFIGKVKELRVERIDQGIRDCFYKIDFLDYKLHALCPLHESKAANTELVDYDCSMGLENGSDISGYLVEKDGEVFLDK